MDTNRAIQFKSILCISIIFLHKTIHLILPFLLYNMKLRNLSVEDLAYSIDVTPTTIRRLLANKGKPK